MISLFLFLFHSFLLPVVVLIMYSNINSASHNSLKITSRTIILRDSIFFIGKMHKVSIKLYYLQPEITFQSIKNRKKQIRRQHLTMVCSGGNLKKQRQYGISISKT